MSFTSLLPERCTIQRKGVGQPRNAWNAVTDAYGTYMRDVPCRTYSSRGTLLQRAVDVVEVIFTLMDIAAGVDIQDGDRVIVHDQTYEVAGVAVIGNGHHQVVQLQGVGS